MTMYFIPGDRKRRKPTGTRLVFGGGFAGTATPRNLVPYEAPKGPDSRAARAAKDERARDVAQAYDMAKHQPNTVRDRLKEARAEAESVAV